MFLSDSRPVAHLFEAPAALDMFECFWVIDSGVQRDAGAIFGRRFSRDYQIWLARLRPLV